MSITDVGDELRVTEGRAGFFLSPVGDLLYGSGLVSQHPLSPALSPQHGFTDQTHSGMKKD